MPRPPLRIRCWEGVEQEGKEWWDWPECGWFLADPWESSYVNDCGTAYSWGGTCKRHGYVETST